jgi:hypothetical protein
MKMRWPFRNRKETDIRIYRDPKTDEITLRLVGPWCFPSPENPIATLTMTLDTKLDAEAIQRLYEQLSHFAKKEVEAEHQPID